MTLNGWDDWERCGGRIRSRLTTRRTDFLEDSCNSPAMISSSSIYVRHQVRGICDGTDRMVTYSIRFLEVKYAVPSRELYSMEAYLYVQIQLADLVSSIKLTNGLHNNGRLTLPKYRSRISTYLWMISSVTNSLSSVLMPQTKNRDAYRL